MAKSLTAVAVALVAATAGCVGEADPGSPDLEAETSRVAAAPAAAAPVLGGDLPGLTGRAAIEIAVGRFNEISQFASYEAFRPEASYNWAYASEGRHYVESYTWIETCGAYVSEAGVVSSEFCYLRIGI
ncbi:MAG TPA: hypothetical protein VFS43_20055 [Polyangiaceae bacterium]|nr:hypothetical protein [Polyangiaceae bacterium]